jgi:UDP:flavonoid glycosyltransferase YjiC (YdhE family)
VRLLFAFTGGRGHLEPLVPIAVAAADAGHSVAFGGRPAIVANVRDLGFTAFPFGRDLTPKRIPLQELDADREDRVLREGFAGRIGRERTADILALAAAWLPDLVVCDEIDFGSMIAAERLGLPYASVLVVAAGSFVRPEVVAEPLDELRAEHGLPPDPQLAMLSRYLVLSPFPPSFRDPAFPLPATAHGFRTVTPEHSEREGPTVYFTLGTVFNVESGDLFVRVLAGLRELQLDVVATVGSEIHPAELGPLPDRIRVERYVAQSSILPRCSAVVSHAGSGTVLGALAHGLPSVLLPMGADQPLNAARCVELGVARVLDAIRATPEDVRDSVAAVLSDPRYRSSAERLRDEVAALPEPAHAVMLLERLVAERRPIVA